jgi:hypothetical protein
MIGKIDFFNDEFPPDDDYWARLETWKLHESCFLIEVMILILAYLKT